MEGNFKIKMKKGNNIMGALLILILFGCSNEPTNPEIEGNWISKTGGEFEFHPNGEFNTKDLPGEIIFSHSDEFRGTIFSESGKWAIKKWQGQWVVDLVFNSSKTLKKGYATRILIAGTGILENKPPWHLFLCEGEEGGPRYKFTKRD